MSSIGQPIDRVDGVAKVTGRATYTAENAPQHMAYGALVLSTIASGRIGAIDTHAARSVSGVLEIFTHENAPRLKSAKDPKEMVFRVLPILQDDAVRYDRQPVALVVADTYERAVDAASLVRVSYVRSQSVLDLDTAPVMPVPSDNEQAKAETRGEPDAALAAATARVDNVYRTPQEYHNPMEPHATVAVWQGNKLTLYDATQGVFPTRQRMADIFGISMDDVRVICPYVGGGFGSKGSLWAQAALAAMAASVLKRPVKIVLDRPQMFGNVGYRPYTEQRVALGADASGKLVSTIHEVKSNTSTFDMFIEPSTALTRALYNVDNLRTSQTYVRLDHGTPTFARAPGESSGSFALESAMDELAYALEIDPLELRLRNYAETDLSKKLPFSSKSLRQCYAAGAERFGWSKRAPAIRATRDGDDFVGVGMATAVYPTNRDNASASVRVHPDGSVLAAAGTQDLGTGAYTVFSQVAADGLGVDVSRVRFELGDTDLPKTPVSGGSRTSATVGPAVFAAAQDARDKVIALAIADARSALYGAKAEDVTVAGGTFSLKSDASKSDSYARIVSANAPGGVEGRADSTPDPDGPKKHSMFAFGAQFAEVRVDALTGMIRVSRMVGAFASGRILNRKTATSQYIGGMTWAISMALHEGARIDARSGRIMNANLGEYLVPVNADVPALEAIIVDEVDPYVNTLGVKGIGEIGIVGGAAAIANAIYHATGKRVRDLPIQPDKLV